jgi:hypothetical protein
MTKHIHYDTIIAWANGAEIEASPDRDKWFEAIYPEWRKSQFYRVKQEPKPDIVHETLITFSPFAGPLLYAASPSEANIVLYFDGATGNLKQCLFKKQCTIKEA